MIRKISQRNRITQEFLNKLFSSYIKQGYNDGVSLKPRNEVENYFNNIYCDWKNVVRNKIKETYKNDPEVQKIINMSGLTISQKMDLLYKYVYDIEKVKIDEEFKTSFDYFENFFTKKHFEELYKKYYNTYPEIEKILNDKTTRSSDYKNKLILIKLYKISAEEFKKNPSFEKLYLKLGNRIEDEFQKADDFFKNKFKYSGKIDYSKFMEDIIKKYKSDKAIKEIQQIKGISDDTKSMLKMIYIKDVLDIPSAKNFEESIKKSIDKMTSFSVYIPYLFNTEQMKEKLNYDYSEALEYFSSKYSIKQSEKIDKLIERYKEHPNIKNIVDVKQLLVSLKQIDEEEPKALTSMKNLITEYYDIIPLNRIIEDNTRRYSEQLRKLLNENKFKYEYKGFYIYRFFLDPEVDKIIKAYTIYKGEIQRIKDEETATEKAKKDAADALIKAKEIEKNKLYEDNLNDAYIITKYERSEKLSKLENDYFDQLIYIIRNGMTVKNYFYNDLERNSEHYEKIKIIFLERKDLEERIINDKYEIAMNYFKNKYKIPKYALVHFDPVEYKINELKNKYDSTFTITDRYYDYYYYPTDELKKKYKIYNYYLYDNDVSSFSDIVGSLKSFINYFGTIFGYLLDRFLLKWIYSLYDTYIKWWYGEKYKKPSFEPSKPSKLSKIENLLKANTDALTAIRGENDKIYSILNNLIIKDDESRKFTNDIIINLDNLNSKYDEFQKYLKNIINGSIVSANNITTNLTSIAESLRNVKNRITNIQTRIVTKQELETFYKIVKDLNLNLSNIVEISQKTTSLDLSQENNSGFSSSTISRHNSP